MVVLMVAGRAAAPEAVLTEIVVVATLTFVAETGERLATTRLARHRVIDWSHTHTCTGGVMQLEYFLVDCSHLG